MKRNERRKIKVRMSYVGMRYTRLSYNKYIYTINSKKSQSTGARAGRNELFVSLEGAKNYHQAGIASLLACYLTAT